MTHSWIVLLPPLFVITCTIMTRNVIASLTLGILSASFIATNYAPLESIVYAAQTVVNVFLGPDKLYLFSFLILLGTVIEMITDAGGISAYTQTLGRYISSKKSTQTASLALSTSFFLDDYFNSLTVGSIMRPLTDIMKIPRVKLAFLINSMSSSLCLIVPASTWVAMILGQLQIAGISDSFSVNSIIQADPYEVYIRTVPYLFYPLFSVFSAWFIVRRSIAFGSMQEYEAIAEKTGNLFGGKEPLEHHVQPEKDRGSLLSFIIPIGTFICSLIFFILRSGDAAVVGGSKRFFEALQGVDSFWALFMTGITTACVTIIYFLLSQTLSYKNILSNSWRGFQLMKNSIIVLLLAYVLSTIVIKDLHADVYLSQTISDTLPLATIPVIIFIIATITTASIGSAWGTIAILLPLTIRTLSGFAPMTSHNLLVEEIPYFFPSLGALLAGSVAGSHFSPLADGAIIASTSARCNLLDHIKTQISYLAPALIASVIAFALIGFLGSETTIVHYLTALSMGLIIIVTTLLFANKKA